MTSPAERYRALLAARPNLAQNLPGGIDVITDLVETARIESAMAERFAKRIEPMGSNTNERLTAGWRLAFSREPNEGEIKSLLQYANRFGLASACRLIFNMNEFVD